MVVQHRNKALVGGGCWLISLAAFITLLGFNPTVEDTSASSLWGWILAALFVLMLCFLWTAYYLAGSKGYSPIIAFFGVLGPPVQAIILLALLFMRDRHSSEAQGSRSRRRSERHGSSVERVVRYRRNALMGIVFGLAGIAAGVFIVLFRAGIFRDPEDNLVLGIFVFIAGYCGVVIGCWWWLKAKEWNEVLVVIAVLPIAILFVPFVRLIFVAAPMLLPAGMVMMPLTLIVVIFALPDKSGARRNRWRDRD